MATVTLPLGDDDYDWPDDGNVVHLIVQEGITKIPEMLFAEHESLETVLVMAISVKIIHK
jgi:hypothetical protein